MLAPVAVKRLVEPDEVAELCGGALRAGAGVDHRHVDSPSTAGGRRH